MMNDEGKLPDSSRGFADSHSPVKLVRTIRQSTIIDKNSKSLPPPNAVKLVDSQVLTHQLLNVSLLQGGFLSALGCREY